ncbi:NUDIX hydrolase [Halobacillus sp. H74]|uniref:NUDIX hydrolase n=1 Tax=Halobacillus sp. H74 TaxID=3457436 RepID=UPI003FCE639F
MKDYVLEIRGLIGSRPFIIVGATIIVENEEGGVLFQFRADTKEWGLPGGAMEPGESLLETAERELWEETGLHAERMDHIETFSGKRFYFRYPNGDEVYNVIAVYKAFVVSGGGKAQGDETLDLQYFTDLPDAIDTRAKEIMDRLGGAGNGE